MTLTQLNAFVLVARLGSVRAAAAALGVSESAVSQALTALRQDLGDQLITRSQAGMTLTPGGSRLLGTASQIVVLGAEAHAAVRAAQGAPEQLRVVATSTFAEFVAGPLMEAFRRRFAGAVEITTGVAAAGELPVLIAPMNGTDGKLVSYAYVSGTLTASTPGDALTVRDRIAFVQDAFVRDVNGAPITRSDDVTQVDKAGLAARLLADARRIIGAARVKAVVIDRVQIAPLHPTQSPEQAPPPAPAPPAAPQQDAAVAKEK